MAKWVEGGADELSGLATTLRTNDLHGLFGKVEQLARSQPAVFVGGRDGGRVCRRASRQGRDRGRLQRGSAKKCRRSSVTSK